MIGIEFVAALFRAALIAVVAVAIASALHWHWIVAGLVTFVVALLLPTWWEHRPVRRDRYQDSP
jgi:cell division protein FtsW (lipid II flippase)